MKFKLSKKQRQFIINSFMICSFISFAIIVFAKLTLPNKSSQDIATTIGGVLGTAFSFFGSILVYLALKAQIDANEQVRRQFERQEELSNLNGRISNLNEKAKLIREELNNFYYSYLNNQYTGGPKKFNYEGVQAIFNLLKQSKENYFGKIIKSPYEIEPKLAELKNLISFFQEIIEEIKNDNIIDIKEKNELLKNMNYLFQSKIKICFEPMKPFKSKHDAPCPQNCGSFHGIPSDLFDYVEKIDELLK